MAIVFVVRCVVKVSTISANPAALCALRGFRPFPPIGFEPRTRDRSRPSIRSLADDDSADPLLSWTLHPATLNAYDSQGCQDIIGEIMRVSKWGNSLAVRLPKALVDDLGLKSGDELEIVSATSKRIAIARDERRALAVERMRGRAWILPDGYTFDRDEANDR